MANTITPFSNFDSAAREILSYLHQQLGFSLWMVTRTEGQNFILLKMEDHSYNLQEGAVLGWPDSFCYRMVRGEGPCVAPQVSTVSAYLELPIRQQIPIGAYIGVPMNLSDGSLFGSLCAIDPYPQPEEIQEELPTVELLAKLLSTILENELKCQEQARRLERIEAEAMSDSLTALYNRLGWEKLLFAEESRCQSYGDPAGVIYIDLDNLKPINDTKGHAAGDQLIYDAARTICSAVREQDIVARIGGDEFVVLGVNCNSQQIEGLAKRIETSLAKAGIEASIGYAFRHPSKGLGAACQEADQKMYECKQGKKRNQLVASPE
jgi:diguanylate cyclase (GGDEF)-like protein